jgi:serine/threonine-protein kinase
MLISQRVNQDRAPGFSISGVPDTIVDPGRRTRRLGVPAVETARVHGTTPRSNERYADAVEVGRGGMGRVYRVKDQDLNRNVAMKVLSPEMSRDSAERFSGEAQISGQLEHPSILPIHDVGVTAEGRAFFTMRYVQRHRTLAEIIQRLVYSDQEAHSVYTFERRVQIIQKVCDALSYAHQRGVIHRDVKPSNIIVGDNGEVYLADWGLAKVVESHDDSVDSTIDIEPTAQGAIAGTPAYMSPEQFVGEEGLTQKTDVYSLCAVAYEFLTLRHYLGDVDESNFYAMMDATLMGPRKDAEDHFDPQNGRVPRQLSRILRKGLQTDRGAGIETSRELDLLLQQWLEGRAPVVCPGTLIQSYLGRLSRWIDHRPTLAPVLTMLTMLLVMWSLVFVGTRMFGLS